MGTKNVIEHPSYCQGCRDRRPDQCRAVEIAVDLCAPDYCHCQLDRGHDGRHRCEHGFHWGGDAARREAETAE
jgi:hypothetical protein